MLKIPPEELQALVEKYGGIEAILLVRHPGYDENGHNLNITTWGDTDEQAGFAALAGRQLAAVIEAQPRSLEDALEVARKIRPQDVTRN